MPCGTVCACTTVHLLVHGGWTGVVGLADVELELGLIRAYHRHMTDFCGQFLARLKGMIVISTRAVDAAVRAAYTRGGPEASARQFRQRKGVQMQGRTKGILMQLGLVTLALLVFPALLRAGAPSQAPVKPTGELRIAFAFLGSQRFIPWAEPSSGGVKQYQMLVYDYLVGCTDDGELGPPEQKCG